MISFKFLVLILIFLLPFGEVYFGRGIVTFSLNNLGLLTIFPFYLFTILKRSRVIPDKLSVSMLCALIANCLCADIFITEKSMLTSTLGNIIFFLYVFAAVNKEDDVKKVLTVFVFGVMVLNVITILDGLMIIDTGAHSGRFSKMGSWQPFFKRTTGIPGMTFGLFGVYNISSLVILLHQFFSSSKKLKLFIILLLLLNIGSGFFLQSRTVWFMYIPVLLITLYLKVSIKKFFISATCLFIFLLIWLDIKNSTEQILNILFMRDVWHRIYIWKMSLDFYLSDINIFLFGAGVDGFYNFAFSKLLFENRVDNFFLTMLCHIGIIGMSIYIYFIVSSFLKIHKIKQKLMVPEISELLCLLITSSLVLLQLWALGTNLKFLWFLFGIVFKLYFLYRYEEFNSLKNSQVVV